MFDFDIGEQNIDILEYVSFWSSNSGCPVTSYRLVDSMSSSTEYIDDRIWLNINDSNSLQLIIKTNQAFRYQTFVVEASTEHSSRKVYQQLKVKVCGFEMYNPQDVIAYSNQERVLPLNDGYHKTFVDVQDGFPTNDR